MPLDLRDLSFSGPALPEPFVKFELEDVLTKWKLLRRPSAAEARTLDDAWESYRRRLRSLAEQGGAQRVASHVLDPLKERLGYVTFTREDEVRTREGDEDGGWTFRTAEDSTVLRAWSVDLGMDLDAPSRRGRAYRFSPERIAERVLLAKGERVGLLTDGQELRVILCDPARTGSHLAVRLDRAGGWRGAKSVPDSFRLVQALCAPSGVARVAELVELARLSQSRVTKTLRAQAETAVLGFVQALLDDPRNTATLAPLREDPATLARTFWREALVVIYRLLFILRLESTADPARAFTFASTSLWRNSYSPNTALARYVRDRLDHGVETGAMLGDGLRTLFRLFEKGVSASELRVVPLGGMLFGEGTTPLLDSLAWSEDGVARLLDRLLWTPRGRGVERQRVHYGALEVEDLGRIYEGLLEKEPGLSTEPMCRLRRQKLEVVLPLAQGRRYRPATPVENANASDDEDEGDEEESEEGASKKAKVLWVEDIPTGRFYLRVGLGRKATGSYYTPDAFVRFLVEKTLGPQVQERSPVDDPNPLAILKIKVLDPAMGSGHFLVGACRYLADKLYEACRLCDEKAAESRRKAENAGDDEACAIHEANAKELIERVEVLPDPNDELLAYLPSRVAEANGGALAHAKALALCRRLVAVHCLYGVDKNLLAVGLAKLALWLESYAEGLPLTFMDHRLVCGDSLTGPFIEHLATLPGRGERMADDLFERVGAKLLGARITEALGHVQALEASVGKDVAEVVEKRAAKERLDRALEPLRVLARVWSGGAMLGGDACDDTGYAQLVSVAAHEEANALTAMEAIFVENNQLQRMRDVGAEGVAYELIFPEVFWPDGYMGRRQGFNAVLGNPPWEGIDTSIKDFIANFDLGIFDCSTATQQEELVEHHLARKDVAATYSEYIGKIRHYKTSAKRYFRFVNQGGELQSGATPDMYQGFLERAWQLTKELGSLGQVLPASFHANEGAAGLRRLLLDNSMLRTCYSFENRRKLFEIDSRYKFALIVADRTITHRLYEFECAFYQHDPDWLFQHTAGDILKYSSEFIRQTTGELLNFLELRNAADVPVAQTTYASRAETWGQLRNRCHIRMTEELHKSKNRWRLVPTVELVENGASDPRLPSIGAQLLAKHHVPFAEGKTFHQYQDVWDSRPEFLVPLARMEGKEMRLRAAEHYRLAFRTVASSTNERSAIFVVLPPASLCSNSSIPESQPWERPTAAVLLLLALSNSFSFDWLLRLVVAANITFNFLDAVPVPKLDMLDRFLAHSGLRLTCNHAGYEAAWREQFGSTWREPDRVQYAWPAVAGDHARWVVRASVDAVVAYAYGLKRKQYAHVLSGFNHKSFPNAPTLCLAAYDELETIGLDAFVKKHDPYWDMPLVETMPKPVIELKVPARQAAAGEVKGQLGFAGMSLSVNESKTKQHRTKPGGTR